jgi:dynein heavy chain
MLLLSIGMQISIRKTKIIKNASENKRRFQTSRKNLLKLLSEATGYIPDNDQLLTALEKTKTEVGDIAIKHEKVAYSTIELEGLCNECLPVVRRKSLLFFLITNLSSISSMYEYL